MKTLYTVALLASLAGCTGCGSGSGGGSSDSSPVVDWSETSENFNISYDVAVDHLIAADLERYWVEVQTCAGISAPVTPYKVPVLYVPADQMPLPTGSYTTDTHTIHIDERYVTISIVVKHEMIHHLLEIIGTPIEQNEAHEPEWLFNTCIYS